MKASGRHNITGMTERGQFVHHPFVLSVIIAFTVDVFYGIPFLLCEFNVVFLLDRVFQEIVFMEWSTGILPYLLEVVEV